MSKPPAASVTEGQGVPHPSQQRRLDGWTVIVPTLGRPILEQCLRSIAAGSALPSRVIVVDQGTDQPNVAGWLAQLERAGIPVLHLVSQERGPAAARNLGLAHVQTMWVAAVDDDCAPEPDWLEAMDRELRQYPGHIITGRMDPVGNGEPPTSITSRTARRFVSPSVRNLSLLCTGNMGFALQTAHAIGPFDAALFTAEDNDWGYRALAAKIPILYSPSVVVQHHHWRSGAETAERYRDYAWGQGNFYGKHLQSGDLRMLGMAGITLFRGVRDALVGWLRHDRSRLLSGRARVTHLIPGMIRGFLRPAKQP